MTTTQTPGIDTARFELRFRALAHESQGFVFPCDERGHVDLDSMSSSLRMNYLFARALIGRDFSTPVVANCTVQ